MGEFFKPWRRKIGVLTLVLACLLTAAWIRGAERLDVIYFNTKTSNVVFISGCGEFWIMFNKQLSIVDMRMSPSAKLIELKICPNNTFLPNNPYISSSRGIAWSAMNANKVGIYKNVNHTLEDTTMVPYWLIVLPLTLLSAVLLLSKPRKTKPLPPIQPEPSSHA